MRLYTYWRSTASYRVRIALALKGLDYSCSFVHLVRAEHKSEAFRRLNPQMRVPALEVDDNNLLTQSLAIVEYLEEIYPFPPLLPADPEGRARIRAVASLISCDIHPLHNSGPLTYLRNVWGRSEDEVSAWIAHWNGSGLTAVEALIGNEGFSFGDEPSLADVFLVPQIYAARRFGGPLEAYPRILLVEQAANAHPAFRAAHPSAQPDAE
ncbi:MAG: maleylacetoacetate isomerase [Mesorhizobium sp.]